MNAIGIDMGGTNIRAGIVTESGDVLKEIKIRTPLSSSSILKQLAEMINELTSNDAIQIQTIGIGASGMIHPQTGEVIGAGDSIPGWLGINLKEYLQEHCSIPVFVDNDVNVAALGEEWFTGMSDFVFVSIGTGLGGAIVHNGQLITGKYGGAGEFGHMILHPNGIPCGCGKQGCAEKYVSGTALGKQAKKIDENWDSVQLMKQLSNKDERAIRLINTFSINLSIVLVNIQTIFDPPTIILGGGFMDSFPKWENKLYEALEKVGNVRKVNFSLSQKRNQIGIIGAARLAMNSLILK